MENQQLQVIDQKPLVIQELTPEEAKQKMAQYQAYVEALLNKDDYQLIQEKEFKKKSAWRKLAMAMNLSVRIVSERREELSDGDYAYHFVCEATHPNGRITGSSGSCTAFEKGYLNSLHNVRSTAETRAWNRAVSNMIAAGEVSAEEADQEIQNEKSTVKATMNNLNEWGICPICDARGEKVGGIAKTGKSYVAFKCDADRTHFFFQGKPEYEKAMEKR